MFHLKLNNTFCHLFLSLRNKGGE